MDYWQKSKKREVDEDEKTKNEKRIYLLGIAYCII